MNADVFKLVLSHFPRAAVYLGAAGLFGLGVYQLSQGDTENAWKAFSHAVGMLGIGHAATGGAAPPAGPAPKLVA